MKKIIKNFMPTHHTLEKQLGKSRFLSILSSSNSFRINCTSISRGVAVGLFFAFLPLPFQMLLAAITSFYVRGNVIAAIALTWITNPVTFVPINYMIFTVGHYVTKNDEVYHDISSFSLHSLDPVSMMNEIGAWIKQVGASFFVGLPIVAITVSVLGYVFVQLIWRTYIYYKIYQRKRSV